MPRTKAADDSESDEIVVSSADTGDAEIKPYAYFSGEQIGEVTLLGEGGDAAASVQKTTKFSGYAVINVGGRDIKIDAKIGDRINFYYREPDIRKAINLGSVKSIIKSVAESIGKLADDTSIGDSVEKAFNELEALDVPGLSGLIDAVAKAELIITDLVIDLTSTPVANQPNVVERSGTIEFGAALSFAGQNLSLLGVQMVGLGFRVNKEIGKKPYSIPPKPTPPTT